MYNLIEGIKQYQQAQGISDSQLANLLGLDRSTWAYIKSGRRNPGMKFIRAVAHIPELSPLIHVEIYDTDKSYNAPQPSQDGKLARFKSWWGTVILRAKKIRHNSREL